MRCNLSCIFSIFAQSPLPQEFYRKNQINFAKGFFNIKFCDNSLLFPFPLVWEIIPYKGGIEDLPICHKCILIFSNGVGKDHLSLSNNTLATIFCILEMRLMGQKSPGQRQIQVSLKLALVIPLLKNYWNTLVISAFRICSNFFYRTLLIRQFSLSVLFDPKFLTACQTSSMKIFSNSTSCCVVIRSHFKGGE